MKGKITICGNEIEYLFSIKGAPLVFLHGFSYPPEYNEKFLNKLFENFSVIAPRLCGMNCFKNQPCTVEDYKEIFVEFLYKLNFTSAHLIGHSMGGLLALEHCKESYSKSRSLIMMNPAMPNERSLLRLISGGIRTNFEESLLCFVERDLNFFDRLIIAKRALSIQPSYLRNLVKDPISSLRLMAELSSYEFKPGSVKIPSFLIQGKGDKMFNYEETKIKFRQQFIGDKLVEILVCGNHEWFNLKPDYALGLIMGIYAGLQSFN